MGAAVKLKLLQVEHLILDTLYVSLTEITEEESHEDGTITIDVSSINKLIDI